MFPPKCRLILEGQTIRRYMPEDRTFRDLKCYIRIYSFLLWTELAHDQTQRNV
jgi:hypothetical protein